MAEHTMPFGAVLEPQGVRFRLFAPAASHVRLALNESAPNSPPLAEMRARGDGWHELFVDGAGAGARYRFVLPDGTRVPDPASRFQPEGVDGPSEVVDPNTFQWTDDAWRGRSWNEAVLYELHIGAFTPEGTFRGAIAKLDHLVSLGVTAIELLCLSAFAGQRSWGYDGVLMFAPDATYGRRDDLKALVNAAHARGLTVILDVVYNHFGPEGNYLPRYFPQVFSPTHKTAWGAGLNFDGPGSKEVRELIVHNALYWIEEFRIDGLRLDASHAMIDTSSYPILNELAERVRASAAGRQVHLVLESEKNAGELLARNAEGAATAYTAQWNHAIDHLLGLAMAGDCSPDDKNALHEIEETGKALTAGFVTGENSASASEPLERGRPVPSTAFIGFIQTHDLVGNRIFGERIHEIAAPEAVRAIAAICLLLPQVPMLFMGEEWAATTPFPFFSDYGGELAEAVRRGRCEQLEKSGQTSADILKRVPDPQAESTFRSAKLNWTEASELPHAAAIEWHRNILAVRRERLAPLLGGPVRGSYRVLGPGRLEAEWELSGGRTLRLSANLCRHANGGFRPPTGDLLWLEGTQIDQETLGGWTVRWSLEE